MADRFCEHLQDYGAQYSKAEAAYRHCNGLVESILAGEVDSEQVEQLAMAVEEWMASDRSLRESIVDLAHLGRVKVPRKKPHATKRHGTIRCSECGFKIIKLKYSEWAISANGLAHFQGKELLEEEMVPAG